MWIFDVEAVNRLNEQAIAALERGDLDAARDLIQEAKAIIGSPKVLKFVDYCADRGARMINLPCRQLAGVA